MKNHNQFIQNLKISQICENTLIIGVDIAKEFNVARAFDFRGFELTKKELKFDNYRYGFDAFDQWIFDIAIANGKTKVVIAAEPTGHYWFPLYNHVLEKNDVGSICYEFVLINPHHVKKTKELDDNSQTKTDKKDAKVIALLVRDGRFTYPAMPSGEYYDLRNYCRLRDKYLKDINRYENSIIRWVDMYYPEIRLAFSDITCKSALIILKEFSFADNIVSTTPSEIIKSLRKNGIRAGVGINKVTEVIELSKDSICCNLGLRSAKFEILDLIDIYENMIKKAEAIEAMISELVDKISLCKELVAINGLNTITVSKVISEIGDLNRFSSPKQLIKLAGLSLSENSSGKHKGKTVISKRGNSRLRAALYLAVRSLIKNNAEFKLLHNYYKNRSINPLTGNQSIIALCSKLLRIIFGMHKHTSSYNKDLVLKGMLTNIQELSNVA